MVGLLLSWGESKKSMEAQKPSEDVPKGDEMTLGGQMKPKQTPDAHAPLGALDSETDNQFVSLIDPVGTSRCC